MRDLSRSRLYLYLAVAATALILLAGPVRADLDSYLGKPEPAYRWERRGEEVRDGCTIYDLRLVSQVWQGITWEHRLQIFRPERLAHPGFCALRSVGGKPGERSVAAGVRLAIDSEAVTAIVHDVPNQPLFGGKTEDELVVHTWLEYLSTGDESWPLHFPMTKAVQKAMDAIQELTREEGFPEITGFLVHGSSKRGWTAWLAGASRDARVKAIAPMVIDVLNLPRQRSHQLEVYGALSDEVDEYARAGIPEKLGTPAGRRLVKLEDPYRYRKRLALPKLVILGTNDRYWTLDALNLYWDGLRGPKWILYAPNSGHGLEDRERVDGTLAAFIRMVARGGRWPEMRWSYREGKDGLRLILRSDLPPAEARVFRARAKTRDFRDSPWTFEPMGRKGEEFTALVPAPEDGYAAVFGEAVFDLDGRPFTLSTQIRILGSGKVRRVEGKR